MPDLTVELTDAEIDEHLGDLWLTNLGRARYADMLKNDLTTPILMPKQYGYMLAKKLLRKVSFGCLKYGDAKPDGSQGDCVKHVQLGLWNMQLSIEDGDGMDGKYSKRRERASRIWKAL